MHSLTFRFKERFIDFSPHVFLIGESFEFILGPSLYLYAKSLAYKDYSLRKRDLLHLIPFGIHFFFYSFKFHFFDADTKIALLNTYLVTYAEYIIIISAIYIHFIVYSILTIKVISNYKIELKNLFSSIEKIKLTWLQLLTGGFILIWGTAFIDFILRVGGIGSFYSYSLSIVLLFIFANMIVYKGLKHPEIFVGINNSKTNGKPPIDETKHLKYREQLDYIMTNEKPYLNPTLSLSDLADKISIPSRYLSHIINTSYEQNFFDFINSYRIKESQRLLLDENHKKKTILEVLYAVGFNSKSSFNSAFKKHTRKTPTQFKNKNE